MQQNDVNILLQSIYDEYQAALRRLAFSFGAAEGDVDDIVQETFISYFDAYSLNWEPERQKAMLVTILSNKCIDYIRKNSHYYKESLESEETGEERKLPLDVHGKDPLDMVVVDESYGELLKDITNMRPEWREIAIMYFLEEKPVHEICGILGIPGTVCSSRIYRIKSHLKKILRRRYPK